MENASPCISFDPTSLSQDDGFLKYESRKASQDNEALWTRPMVMSGSHYFVFHSRIKNFSSTNIFLQSALHIDFTHGYFYPSKLTQTNTENG
jgi:hypothetical protein